jgi:hypothetical protein
MTRRIHTTVKVKVSIHLTTLVLVGCRPEKSSQHTISSKAKQIHDVVVTDVSVPSPCVQGNSVPVTVTVENQGNSSEEIEVLQTDIAAGKVIGRKSLMLSAAGQGGMTETADLAVRNTGEVLLTATPS